MGRAPCCSKVGLNRGPWTPEEDMLLSKYIEAHGEGNWRALPKAAGLLRCGKSCRLRWVNYLRPNVKRGNISEDEEDLIIMLHALLGNRWSLIAARMPGRTDNEIKNYWNTHLSKKLASRGLDPKTHKPIISNKSQKKPEESSDEDPQEAWETTMDMDTSSYSTGSCDEDHPHGYHRRFKHLNSKSLRQIQSPTDHKKPSPISVSKTPTEQQKHSKFDCPSPSSVLNAHSPTPSASNSGSNSSSSSDHSSGSTIHEDDRSGAASGAPPEECMELGQLQAPDTHQMLEFIDEFLSREPQTGAPELFKEEGGSEFWDSLGKIELLECSPVCQSDLWDGLTDFLPSQLATAPSIVPQHFPGSTDNSLNIIHQIPEAAQMPLLSSSQAPCVGTHFLQDNISELLFCS